MSYYDMRGAVRRAGDALGGPLGVWLILLMLLLTTCSCTTTRTIEKEVERVRTDSVYITRLERDSVYERDSIYVMVKGDTVREYRDRWRWRDRMVHDTIVQTRIDSVAYYITEEKALSRWQRWKLELGGWAFGAIGIIIIGLGATLITRKL